jgi:PAS domain S-box-containing protein
MKKCNILIVEDEALIAANLVHTLSSLGYAVHKPVATGEDAIRAVKARQPDLVLMDIELIGEMNGIEAAEKIRAIADIPIVYLTAYSDDLRLKQARLTEPYGYIVKPAHSRELHATIEMALYKHGLDRKLKASEEKYRDIFENSVMGLFQTVPSGRMINVNNALARMYGFSDAAEMLAADLYVGNPPYANPVDQQEVRHILAEKGNIENYEALHLKWDGTRFWVSITARIKRDTEGNVLLYEGTVIDITERKLAEDALLLEKNYSDRLLDAPHDTVFLFEPSTGKPIRWNKRFSEVSGYTDNEIADMKAPRDFYDTADLNKATEYMARNYTENVTVELSLVTKQGAHIPFEYSATPIETADGKTLLLSIGRNITERKQAEENLVATLKRTQDQQAALGEISFSPHLFSGDVHGLSARLTEVSSAVLGVERASVWLFNNNEDELRCIDLYEVLYDRHSYDGILKRREYVNEFEVLRTAKYIDADDPLTDPRTAGYVKGYLKPNRITSMLDAVIRVSGQNLGVLCFEHVDRSHHWETDEIAFACQIADQIAITLLNRDRKRAEEALLKKAEELDNKNRLFSTLLDTVPIGVFMVEAPSGKPILSNREATRLLGRGILPDTTEANLAEVYEAHKIGTSGRYPTTEMPIVRGMQGESSHIDDMVVVRPDGTRTTLEIFGNPVFDRQDHIIASLVSFLDITERKLAEVALRNAHERLRCFVDANIVGIVFGSPSGEIIEANDYYLHMIGYTREEFENGMVDWRAITPPEWLPTDDRAIEELRKRGKCTPYEKEYLRRDGSRVPVSLSDALLPGPEEYIAAFIVDITERKKADEALAIASKKLTLLSGITRHDINNQLLVLNGFLGFLQRKVTDPTLEDYFTKITKASERIATMIQFTKEYEKIGVNAPVWQDCRTLVDTTVKQAPLGQVIVKNDFPPGTEVFADPLIVKVCYNLMDNAVRYGGKITTIRFSVERHDGDHILVCEDDGDGVPQNEKERIFERGFGKNTGLGLALSREILSITGITIKETGEPGKGARFEMAVPKGAWQMKGNGA